jgi:sugar-specific transcriptional regulator TrmB
MNNIASQLHFLGLSQKEIEVYSALIELGQSHAQSLAKRAHINRTTTYAVLRRLTDRGLVSQKIEKGVRYFSVNAPQALLEMIAAERRQLNRREQVAHALVEQITPQLHQRQFTGPALQIFDGEANVRAMLGRFLLPWLESMRAHDNTLWGYQDHTFVEEYHDWLGRYWKAKDSRHRICLFSNRSQVESKLARTVANRTIKVLKAESILSSTLWISGDYITMIVTRTRPHYAFQIVDPIFADNLRLIFRGFWELQPAATP